MRTCKHITHVHTQEQRQKTRTYARMPARKQQRTHACNMKRSVGLRERRHNYDIDHCQKFLMLPTL